MRRILSVILSSALMLQVAPLLAAPMPRSGGAQAPAANGTITGTAQSSTGQTLPNYTVRVRNLQTGELAGTTMSNAAGSFSFTGLSPANYIVEIVDAAGKVVGLSSSLAVVAGGTLTVTVSSTAAAAIAGAAGHGISTALVVTTVAAAAGIAGVVVVVKNNASPSR